MVFESKLHVEVLIQSVQTQKIQYCIYNCIFVYELIIKRIYVHPNVNSHVVRGIETVKMIKIQIFKNPREWLKIL